MKASDTVMPFSQIEAIDLKNAESNFTDALVDVAREQAEISFKMGYDQCLKDHKGVKYPLGSIENKQDNRYPENLALLGSNSQHNKEVERLIKQARNEGYKAGIKEVVEFWQPRLNRISECVSEIQGDWSDPRSECKEISKLIDQWESKLKEFWEL